MIRHIQLLLICTALLLGLTGIALSQRAADEPPSFEFIRQIGEIAPRDIEYDPNFDRLVMVDDSGRLLLVNAATFAVEQVLYEDGRFSAYEFSHDGRQLALAVDQRVEVWDTTTGERDLTLDPTGALRFAEPLLFTPDDELLLVTAIVPAPDDVRRSETDTATLPWIWDLAAERRERRSTLRGSVIAQPFFDLRNAGFVLGPNNKILHTRVDLVQLLDLTIDGYPEANRIETIRAERDPFDVWFSERGEQMYFRPVNQDGIYQIDTNTDTITQIPTGRELTAAEMERFESLALGDQATIIGEPGSRTSNSLLRLLLGEGYRRSFGDQPLTVILIDVLEPVTLSAEQKGLLVYIFNEGTGRGVLDLVRPADVTDMALHPDNRHLMVRRLIGNLPVEVYDLETGNLELTIEPALPDPDGRQLLAYNADGSVILSHFQRFDATTGALLNENLRYHPGFEQFFFSDDSASIITRVGSTWWEWDIATGNVIRREAVNLRGEVLRASPSDRRYLTRLDTETRSGVELVDIGLDERRSVLFDNLPGRVIEQVIPSPDWDNYLVVYSANPFSQHYPGNEIALYSLTDGLRWHIAGADLPRAGSREYGWTDNTTAFIRNEGGPSQPERIYGLEYHPSGLPQCLVEAFPEGYVQWTDLWEQFNNRLNGEQLGRLTVELCAALPGSFDDVEAVFFPSPTPTRIPVSPTPSFIAGVPSCLTARFRDEGLAYAQAWRQIIADLTPEEAARLENLLCEGLVEVSIPAGRRPVVETFDREVMIIDMETGLRADGTFLPDRDRRLIDEALVYDEFVRTEGFEPADTALSPDTDLFAVRTPSNHIAIYRLVRTYDDLVAEIQATLDVQLTNAPQQISLLPTATAPFDRAGLPRPTRTPTVTPTAPPPPAAVVDQPQRGEVVELCADDTLHHISVPPPGYAATGRLLTRTDDSPFVVVYDPATGRAFPDETIIDPTDGQLSFDENWVLRLDDAITVTRADGSDGAVLFTLAERPVHPDRIYWLDPQTVEYTYRGYLPDESADAVTLLRRYNVMTRELSAPFQPPAPIEINELPTETLSTQPGRGTLALVTTSFNAGLNRGFKYYIYDRATGATDYFARLTDSQSLQFEWHPLGWALYYRYPGDSDWYSYDTLRREHRLLGDLPGGAWSRDGRLRAEWFTLPDDEREDRIDEGLPLPGLRIWDSETGLTRHYCIPQTGTGSLSAPLVWSPDNRYLAFQVVLPDDSGQEVFRPRTLILDIETGSVTQLTFAIDRLLVWID